MYVHKTIYTCIFEALDFGRSPKLNDYKLQIPAILCTIYFRTFCLQFTSLGTICIIKVYMLFRIVGKLGFVALRTGQIERYWITGAERNI